MANVPLLHTRRGILLGTASLAAMSATSAAHAQLINPLKAVRATDIARTLREAQPAPALSLAVANARGILWAEAYGKADLQLDIEVNPVHRFKLGSVSKVLTSTAAARLASRGVLDLDAPISTYKTCQSRTATQRRGSC
ncbi:MAG: class C beta-lactamase-related serine hydrolase [Alphaproteobacteria bacterium]|nr:class C beta-lactamase-related serine hydrolase [Alphaproteobacteria bacterium]